MLDPWSLGGDAKPLRSCFHYHSKGDMHCFVIDAQSTQTQATRTPLLRLTLSHSIQGNCLMGKSKRHNERLDGSVKATEHLVTMHCSSIQSSFLCKWVTNTVHMESWTSHPLLTITFLCTQIWESELTSNYSIAEFYAPEWFNKSNNTFSRFMKLNASYKLIYDKPMLSWDKTLF